jgi:hypothetical protein
MTATLEIPFPPRHHPTASGRLEPPLVPVEPRWEYREIVRDAPDLLSEAELNALGDERWRPWAAGFTSTSSVSARCEPPERHRTWRRSPPGPGRGVLLSREQGREERRCTRHGTLSRWYSRWR